MADKTVYRAKEGIAVPHSKFKGAVDDEFVNSEAIPAQFLKVCTNLTPFRKIGALKRAAGTSYVFQTDQMPQVPNGYECIDMYYFTIDKDSQEITLLIYKHKTTGETKFFINPYWNPPQGYSNHILTKTPESWIYEWFELTEYHDEEILSLDGSLLKIKTQYPNKYFGGWFACFYDATDGISYERLVFHDFRKYNFVVTSSENTLWLSNPVNGIHTATRVFLCRFPIAYLYNVSALNQELGQWAPTVNHFKAVPTDFIYKENTLRMPCGKESRPLILTWIDKQEYFQNIALEGSSVVSVTLTDPKPNQMANTDVFPTVTFSASQDETPAQGQARIGLHPTCELEKHVDSGPFIDGEYYEWKQGVYIVPFMVKANIDPNTGVVSFEVINPGLYTQLGGSWRQYMQLSRVVSGGGGGIEDEFPPLVKFKFGKEYWAIHDIKITSGGSYNSTNPVTIKDQDNRTIGYGNLDRTILDPVKYEGFWFDVAQVPQTYDSILFSGFNAYMDVNGAHRSFYFTNNVIAQQLEATLLGYSLGNYPSDKGYMKITCLSGSTGFAITFRANMQFYIDHGCTTLLMKEGYTIMMESTANRELIILGTQPKGKNISITAAEMKEALQKFTPFKHCKIEYVNPSYYEYKPYSSTYDRGPLNYFLLANEGGYFGGKEAGDASETYNSFLGMGVESSGVPPNAGIELKRNVGIVSALVDNRNEVIVGMGTFCSNEPININQTEHKLGIHFKFSPWFNRRIRSFNFYNKQIDIVQDKTKPLVASYKKFPYFIWATPLETENYVRINEIPLFLTIGVDEPYTPVHGEVPSDLFNGTAGSFSYKATTQERWIYLSLTNSTEGLNIAEDGKGFPWISNANRFVDEDITMNYTKGVFVGQTNGRFFIIGCKNTVNPESIIDTNDRIYYNVYGSGVSQYDIFVEAQHVAANIGDKDIVRGIGNFAGYLTIVKDTSTYLLDVISSPEEIKYRVVDTFSGIGTTLENGVCEVPFGTVIVSDLGVWLDSRGKLQSLMSPSNCRIGLYREIMASGIESVFVNYYHRFGEIVVSIVTKSEELYYLYQFIYSIEFKFWTTYVFNLGSNKLTKARVGSERNLWYLITGNSGSCITEIDESSYRFRLPASLYTTIPWMLETHYLPYGGRLSEILFTWLTLTCDYTSGNDINIKVGINKAGTSETTHVQNDIVLPKTTAGIRNYIKDMILEIEPSTGFFPTQMASLVLYSNTETIEFVINSIYLWIQAQKRVPNL